jgi:hypothetical protein
VTSRRRHPSRPPVAPMSTSASSPASATASPKARSSGASGASRGNAPAARLGWSWCGARAPRPDCGCGSTARCRSPQSSWSGRGRATEGERPAPDWGPGTTAGATALTPSPGAARRPPAGTGLEPAQGEPAPAELLPERSARSQGSQRDAGARQRRGGARSCTSAEHPTGQQRHADRREARAERAGDDEHIGEHQVR